MKTLILPLLAACLLQFQLAGPARAEENRGAQIWSASAGDSDISTRSGARAMLGRLLYAADRECGRFESSRDADSRHAVRACAEAAVADAVDQSGSRNVSAQYAAWRRAERRAALALMLDPYAAPDLGAAAHRQVEHVARSGCRDVVSSPRRRGGGAPFSPLRRRCSRDAIVFADVTLAQAAAAAQPSAAMEGWIRRA